MTDFATLKARIADELSRDDLTSQINNAVLDAVKRYETQPFWFNQTEATLNTAANDEFYALPSDFLQIDSLRITYNEENDVLAPRSYRYIDDRSQITGEPTVYAIYRDQLRLYPIPDQVYPLTMAYIYRPAALSGDTDSNVWTTDAEELIRGAAARRLCLTVIRDPQAAALWAQVEYGALRALLSRTALSTTTGTLHPSGF